MTDAGPHDTRSDQELITAINAGDDAAFDELYDRYKQWAVNLAFRFVGNHELALDAMQETFVYVYKKFPGFELTCQFKTFLYPVVRHTSIRLAKKRRRLNPQQTLVDADLGGSSDSTAPIDLDAAAANLKRELSRVMAALPETHREVVLLRFIDDLSMAEIGEAMEIPVGTVKSRLHHALKQLREDPATKKYFGQ